MRRLKLHRCYTVDDLFFYHDIIVTDRVNFMIQYFEMLEYLKQPLEELKLIVSY